jgi:hypothetical protein
MFGMIDSSYFPEIPLFSVHCGKWLEAGRERSSVKKNYIQEQH